MEIKNLWLPDVEILHLKDFETLKVLSKLEGLWIDSDGYFILAKTAKITFHCNKNFNSFPLDVQICIFQIGSFNYDMSKMIYENEFVPDERQIRLLIFYIGGSKLVRFVATIEYTSRKLLYFMSRHTARSSKCANI